MPKSGPMFWTWAGWEPAQFYRRLGGFHEQQEGNAYWTEDWFRRLESEETARVLAEAGINWVTTHFYKGFGLACEREEMAGAARLIANYHRHGIKVFTYLQYGTIMLETLTAEMPESSSWRRHDWHGAHDGHPYEYGDQYWRAKPCANQPGMLEYLCRVIDAALAADADGIWIDNLNADGCHCSACQEAFRQFIGATITDPWRELGVSDLKRIAIPRAERPRDPLFQAWVSFRCTETRHSLTRLCAYARAQNPAVMMAANIGLGNHQRHVIDNGNWPGMLGVCDYTYAENGRFPAWREESIISQHWPMSVANAVGTRVVPGAWFGGTSRLYPRPAVPDSKQLRRCFAESALNGGQAYGGPWGLRGEDGGGAPVLMRDAGYRQTHRQLVDWYCAHQPLFADSTEDAPVAVLNTFAANVGDETAHRQAREAMEQLLLQQQIPFRAVVGGHWTALRDVALLILPHLLPMSDEEVAQIQQFVQDGGKVLATGRTSLYDAWMRQRADYALAEVLGVQFSPAFEDAHHDALLRNPANSSLFVPGAWGLQCVDGAPACRVTGERVARAIRDALPVTVPDIYSPLPHVGCTLRRLANGQHLLGLLNYADAPVCGIVITVSEMGATTPSVVCWNTTQSDAQRLPVISAGPGRWRVYLPALAVEWYVQW